MVATPVIRKLAELDDVGVSSPADGDILQYDAGAGKFENVSGGSLASTGDVVISADTDGSGSGDIIFKTDDGVERARIFNDGTASGLFSTAGNNLPTLNQIGTLDDGGAVTRQPYRNFYRNKNGAGNVLMWQDGLDTSNDTGNGLLDSFYLFRGFQDGTAGGQDELFITDYGDPAGHAPLVAFGFGYTPPPSGFRAAISAPDGTTWGALRLRMGALTTGEYLHAAQSGGTVDFKINNDGSLRGRDYAADALGLRIVDVGNAGSNVLTVVGRTDATANVFQVNLSGAAGYFSVAPDGAADVEAVLHGSGGVNTVVFRTQTTIAKFAAHSAADNILILKMAATPSASPLIIQSSTGSSLFEVDQTGSLVSFGNLQFGTSTGSKIGTASNQKIGVWGATPIVQPVLATGAGHTADDIITVLQDIGWVRQS